MTDSLFDSSASVHSEGVSGTLNPAYKALNTSAQVTALCVLFSTSIVQGNSRETSRRWRAPFAVAFSAIDCTEVVAGGAGATRASQMAFDSGERRGCKADLLGSREPELEASVKENIITAMLRY